MPHIRRFLPLIALPVAALALAQSGATLLTAFRDAISGAQSLQTTYTVTPVGGAGDEYSILLKKPNLARVDTPTRLYVADGTTLTTFLKGENKFVKEAQSAENLRAIFAADALNVWAGFFDPKGYAPQTSRNLPGGAGFQAAFPGRNVAVYLDANDKIARRAQIDVTTGTPQTLVLNAKDVAVNGEVADGAFVFAPPADAKEVSAEELNSARWLTDLSEAKRIAKATNKRIFVDFMADWCGPCKKLEAEVFKQEKWKGYASKVVFLKIDVDRQKNVAQAYQITAMPTQMVLDADGGMLSSTVGYGDPATFYNWIDGALAGR